MQNFVYQYRRFGKMGSRRKLTGVIFSPEGNRRIRLHIAQDLDKITALVNGATLPMATRVALVTALGEFGDYLLDTDIRYCEDLG